MSKLGLDEELELYKDDKIYFHLPDYHGHFRLNYLIATLLKEEPEVFYDGVAIGSIYGSFPSAIWNGGRVIFGGLASRDDMVQCYKAFNDLGIPLRHTFTNSLIDEHLCWDAYCNEIMKMGDNGMNQILVNSPALEAYIDEHYPNYPKLSSTTKRLRSVSQAVEELEKGYALVVLDYDLNHDPDIFLLDHPERFEILINAYCMDKCPKRVNHYKSMAQDQIHFGHIPMGNPEDEVGPCQFIGDDFWTAMNNRKNTLKVEEIYGFYRENGFKHFKIEGRTTNDFDVLESYMYYMIKPEFRDHVRLRMLRRMFLEQQGGPQQVMVMTPEQIKQLQESGQIQFNPDDKEAFDKMMADTEAASKQEHTCDGSCEGGCCNCGSN